ncbi:MAG: hypothetical protein ACYTGZ_10455 [Planctomycetota bacterium]|jgi:hypothetical protein
MTANLKWVVALCLVLALVAAPGCGSGGGGGGIKLVVASAQDVQVCVTDGIFLLTYMTGKLDTIFNVMADEPVLRPEGLEVNNPSGNTWTFVCDFPALGTGPNDTQVSGTVVFDGDPTEGLDGLTATFSDVEIVSLGGPVTGSAENLVVVINEANVQISGEVSFRDASTDCGIRLTLTDFLVARLLRGDTQREGPQLTAALGLVLVSGQVGFDIDFPSFFDVGGTATFGADSQQVLVQTDGIGTFSFDLFPAGEDLASLTSCFSRARFAVDQLAIGLQAVVGVATGGPANEMVTIDGTSFGFEGPGAAIEGTLSLLPPSATFAFESAAGLAGGTVGPLNVTIPLGGGDIGASGEIEMGGSEPQCDVTVELIGATFNSEGGFDAFAGGTVVFTLSTVADEIVVEIDYSDPGEGRLDGVTATLNGVELPPIAMLFLLPLGDAAN